MNKEGYERLLRESIKKGTITCEHCGNILEPDDEKCLCGWSNPLIDKKWVDKKHRGASRLLGSIYKKHREVE